jgi:hypothetical protein
MITRFRSHHEKGKLPLDKDSKKKIDDNGSIALATLPTPVIEPNHSYLPNSRRGNEV